LFVPQNGLEFYQMVTGNILIHSRRKVSTIERSTKSTNWTLFVSCVFGTWAKATQESSIMVI